MIHQKADADAHTDTDADPEYRIAYDVDHRKVGCILVQAALGGDVPRDLFFRYFGTDTWTLDASACTIYPIRPSQLTALAARTSSDHPNQVPTAQRGQPPTAPTVKSPQPPTAPTVKSPQPPTAPTVKSPQPPTQRR